MVNLKLIKQKILRAKRIAVASHINPDGDSLGSLLSLGLALKKLGKRVYLLSPDGVPKRYRRLPGAGGIIRKLNKPVDLAVAVDCSNREILGRSWGTFQKAKDILEIDHHEFRRPFGNIRLVDTRAAAVGELIYPLLKDLKINIDTAIAQNLLTSVVVETDSFRLPNVRPFTFEICHDLMKKKVDFYKLVDMVFWSKTKESTILSGICMARCKFLKNGRLAWSIVRQKDFRNQKGKDEDVDPVADEMRSIKGVRIAVFFREKDNSTLRVSLRSKGKINVAGIAEHFGGGGHFDVAGCSIANKPKAMNKLLAMAKTLLK
ncbi:MAG: hypothetical protein FJZ09_02355 [Candidatus Omnitrophica bacterium]|nr:hypothetical protein [Candidatus Omnitrophota bacterium]